MLRIVAVTTCATILCAWLSHIHRHIRRLSLRFFKRSRRAQVAVETNKKLGELAALCKLDAEGNPTKVVGCSSACIIDYGEETEALKVLKGMIKQRNA